MRLEVVAWKICGTLGVLLGEGNKNTDSQKSSRLRGSGAWFPQTGLQLPLVPIQGERDSSAVEDCQGAVGVDCRLFALLFLRSC